MRSMKKKGIHAIISMLLLAGFLCRPVEALTTIKVGLLKVSSSAPLFVGMDKGFFQAEGIKLEPVWFKAAQPIALALASGDIDIGATGLTAGLYNAAAQGTKLAVVADKGREWPGYKLCALMVDANLAKAGVRDLAQLKGKRIGITQVGSTFHYMLGNLLEKKGMSLKDVTLVPLGGLGTMRDALVSHQIDAAFVVQPHVSPLEKERLAEVLLWVGDQLPYQLGGIFLGEKMMKNRPLAVAFLRAYVRSCRNYHENGLLKKPGVPSAEVLALIARYSEEKPEDVAAGLTYIDPNGSLFSEDIQKQIDWYHTQGLLTRRITAAEIMDLSYHREALQQLKQ
jgi:NitT/TauT family transport system substrate-binding protein